MRLNKVIRFFPLMLIASISDAGPYSGVMETADLVKKDHFRAAFETFIAFNHGGQFNPILHAGYAFDDRFDVQAVMGTGAAEFQFGGGGKWQILPDVSGQVAFSVAGLVKFVHSNQSIFLLEFYPVVSKQFHIHETAVTPYAAFQVDGLFTSGSSTAPLNLTFGSRVVPPDWKTFQLFGEFGISLHDSSHYMGLQIAMEVDDLFDWDQRRVP